MLETVKNRYDAFGPTVVKALKKRHFEAFYCSTKQEALEKAISLISSDHIVSWGGSMTADEIGLRTVVKQKGYKIIDRDTAKNPEERTKLMKDSLTCNTFIMSSNAITQDGELFNIDGVGNRVAALCYGPDSVLVIAGMNKIVKDMDEAYLKVRNFTAPCNNNRFNLEIPCKITGACSDCLSPQSCCCEFVETRMCRPEGRIKVILVGEHLGI